MATLTVAAPGASLLQEYAPIIADELNVKAVLLVEELSSVATPVAKPIPAKLGPKLGSRMKEFMAAFKHSGATVITTDSGMKATVVLNDGTPVTLDEGEFEFSWKVGDGTSASDNWAALGANSGVVLLDTVLTEELVLEGLARGCDAVPRGRSPPVLREGRA